MKRIITALNDACSLKNIMHSARVGISHALQMRYRKYIRAILPEHLRKYAYVEAASSHNLALEDEGMQFVKCWLYPGQRSVHHGVRSEISVFYPFVEGETIRYEWRVRLYGGSTGPTKLDQWMVVAQWHDQPDPNQGENWKTFPHRDPPIHLYCHTVGTLHYLCLFYGAPSPADKGEISVPINKWIRLVAKICWSQGDAGRFSLYVDDVQEPLLKASGPNMHNSFFHSMKVGNYRHPNFDFASCVDIGGIQVQHCPEHTWEN